jgi:hypothetical protein
MGDHLGRLMRRGTRLQRLLVLTAIAACVYFALRPPYYLGWQNTWTASRAIEGRLAPWVWGGAVLIGTVVALWLADRRRAPLPEMARLVRDQDINPATDVLGVLLAWGPAGFLVTYPHGFSVDVVLMLLVVQAMVMGMWVQMRVTPFLRLIADYHFRCEIWLTGMDPLELLRSSVGHSILAALAPFVAIVPIWFFYLNNLVFEQSPIGLAAFAMALGGAMVALSYSALGVVEMLGASVREGRLARLAGVYPIYYAFTGLFVGAFLAMGINLLAQTDWDLGLFAGALVAAIITVALATVISMGRAVLAELADVAACYFDVIAPDESSRLPRW